MKNYVLLISAVLFVSCSSVSKKNVNIVSGLVYTSGPQALKGDLYLPIDVVNPPVIITLHGGVWLKRSQNDMGDIIKPLVNAGFAVFNVDYRQPPDYTFLAPIEDLREAIRFLAAQQERYSYNMEKLGLYGYSLGGYVAAMVALSDLEKGSRDTVKVKALAVGGTPSDLVTMENADLLEPLVGERLSEMPGTYKRASPLQHVNRGDPPVFLFHGKNDWVVPYQQMIDFERKLAAEGVGVETFTIPTLGHVAVFLYADRATRNSIEFFKENLK